VACLLRCGCQRRTLRARFACDDLRNDGLWRYWFYLGVDLPPEASYAAQTMPPLTSPSQG